MTPENYYCRGNNELLRIIPDEVIFIEVKGNYVEFISLRQTKLVVRTSLDAVLKKLPEGMFLKTSRTFAAGLNYIYSISREMVKFFPEPDKIQIPMTKQYYSAFIKNITIIDAARVSKGERMNSEEDSSLDADSDSSQTGI
jgi:DNA-binding LytR/AlgR family response regulator